MVNLQKENKRMTATVEESAGDAIDGRPMVSVVMVAYNSAKYIEDAIRGVVNQRTEFPVQLIISDDASTDDTEAIVSKWAARYPDIVEYHRNESNLGVQKNYLAAFRHCRGKYLAMCDADDYWTCRTKLARQVSYMEKHPECAICFHRVINYYEGCGEMSLSNGGGSAMQIHNAYDLSQRNVITNMSVLSRMSLLDFDNLPEWLGDVRLLDYAMHMLFAASRPENTIHFFKRPMGVYRHSAEAIWTMTEKNTRIQMAIDVREHLIEEFADRPDLVANLKRACADMQSNMNKPDAPAKRKLLSRVRGAVSRLVPVPRP